MSVFDGEVSPTVAGGCVIGACSHINGPEAEPSGVVVTRHELAEVARYWYRQQLDNDYCCFLAEQSGSYEWRLSVYCAQRLAVIIPVIGDERMWAIEQEVIATYREEYRIDDEAWRIVTSGTPDERAAWLAIHGYQAHCSKGASENA